MPEVLRIDRVALANISRFDRMSVSFGSQFNLICGPNGVGKTTLLDAIASAFVSNMPISLRRNANAKDGRVSVRYRENNGIRDTVTGEVQAFHQNERQEPFGRGEFSNRLIYVKSSRDFSYSELQGVMRDPDKPTYLTQEDALNGVRSADIKQWFSNRYLMKPHGDHWPPYRHRNLELGSQLFSLLDDSVELAYVDSSTFDIMLRTGGGLVPFEYMSSGFRASFAIMLGIIKEIEFRRLEVAAEEFRGVILIDELDLHLHPTWHAALPRALKSAFPSAQIIATTHSPHMIQAMPAREVIVLAPDSPSPRDIELANSEFGFKGWTIEEILQDVMGMGDVRPPEFRELMEKFEAAVSGRNRKEIELLRERLSNVLHPSSVLKKLIEISSS